MTGRTLPHPLRGVIPPLITPLLEPDQLDRAGLHRLIEHIIAGGVHGIFVLGTTGEGPSLSHRLRREMIELTCRSVARRVPVLVGVTDPSADETIRLSQYAAEVGASAVVLAPPFYFPIDQADLIAYFRGIIPTLPLPTFLYNMPSHTKISFSADLIRQLIATENLVGLKDSAPRASCFYAVRDFVLRQRPDFSLLIGPEEEMIAGLRNGAHGGVCGGANVFPQLFVSSYNAVLENDAERADALQQLITHLADTVYAAGANSNGSGYAAIRAIKRALQHLGICSDLAASPMQPLGAQQRSRIDQSVDSLVSSIESLNDSFLSPQSSHSNR